ncbi:hypothetical protein W02_00770 [Nitrospira sp. KM1]|uniref:YciI family protein n=1 Tax=Nitrospira sp. KM1 TaxID=1936990 RepID=UPI0013A7AB15|nr:YciI family protein [Nitrospira sp. KM1]BCA52937.1 hypothetical protein W02_00770 [Nitrospira sp. KM1]
MKYFLMCCHDQKTFEELPKHEEDAIIKETMMYCESLRTEGTLISSEALDPTEAATAVRVRNGKTLTTDGPFAETKEQFGGFFLIETRDFNEAIRVASKFPSARIGSIVIRPVLDLEKRVADSPKLAGSQTRS